MQWHVVPLPKLCRESSRIIHNPLSCRSNQLLRPSSTSQLRQGDGGENVKAFCTLTSMDVMTLSTLEVAPKAQRREEWLAVATCSGSMFSCFSGKVCTTVLSRDEVIVRNVKRITYRFFDKLWQLIVPILSTLHAIHSTSMSSGAIMKLSANPLGKSVYVEVFNSVAANSV